MINFRYHLQEKKLKTVMIQKLKKIIWWKINSTP